MISKFNGLDYQVAKEFAESFDGQLAQVGNLILQIIEEFIARAT